jgi:tRNA nucleotidyltransferase (CCA-adding enzyme)
MNHPQAVASLLRRQATVEQLTLLDATIAAAKSRQIPIYLVGGAVRDLLLGRFTGDLDLVVEGSAPDLAKTVASNLDGDLEIHPRFGTAKVSLGSSHVDLASSRKEHYRSPAALPVIEPGTLDEDLARRDFTVNAMAVALWPSKDADLIDPYDGVSDLQRGVLEVLHPKSFEDDPTRILRAVRIESQSTLRLSNQTAELAREAAKQGVFDRLSGVRLRHELELLFNATQDVESVAARLDDLALLHVLSPNLALSAETLSWLPRLTREALDQGSSGSEPDTPEMWPVVLLVLAGSLEGADRASLARRLDLSGAGADLIEAGPSRLLETETELNRPDLPPHGIDELLQVSSPEERILLSISAKPLVRDRVARWNREIRTFRLSITGADLLARGVEPGPAVGQALAATRQARVDGRIEAEDELEFALAQLASSFGTT